ncbi:MAG: TLD domain-containing protein [archaeon]|nr:TLD domain-containing protein [archaeon]
MENLFPNLYESTGPMSGQSPQNYKNMQNMNFQNFQTKASQSSDKPQMPLGNDLMSPEASSLLNNANSDPIVCPQCGTSMEIEEIKLEDGEYKMTFKCQNEHRIEDQSLTEYMTNQPKESKEITICKDHNGEKYVAYCTKCNKNLCMECVIDDEHMNEKGAILNYPQIFPPRKVMKEFIQQKTNELEDLKDSKNKMIQWLDKLKDRTEKLFQSQEALIEFQKAFVEHFTLRKLNYTKIKSLNYLMNQLKYHHETPNLKENQFDKNFNPIEQQIFDIVGLETPIVENEPEVEPEPEVEVEKEPELTKDKLKIKLNLKEKPNQKEKKEDLRGNSKGKEKPGEKGVETKVSFGKPKVVEYDQHAIISPVKGGNEEPEEDIVFTVNDLKSKIIKKNQDLNYLIGFFDTKPKGFVKLYNGMEEDGSASAFHKNCDNKGPTLVVVKPANGGIIGGYTEKPWGGKGSHINDPKSWVFNLDKKKKFEAISGDGIYSDPTMGPIFEGENNSVLEISDNAFSDKTSLTKYCPDGEFSGANLNNERKAGDETLFRIVNYEVYQVL